MRVSDKMNYNQVTGGLQRNRADLAELQQQAATQKKLTKPSDDPVAATKVLSARSEESSNSQFIKNINVARSFLEYTDVSLNEIAEVLMRMKELSIQQASDAGASDDTRRVVAEEVAQSHAQLVQIGNRKLGDRYVFGGFRTTQAPFDMEGNYRGDSGDIRVQINKDAFVAMNLPGDRLFLGESRDPSAESSAVKGVPKNLDELQDLQKQRLSESQPETSLQMRGPASTSLRQSTGFKSEVDEGTRSLNILQSLKAFEIALRVNDKQSIQDSIDSLDFALAQVVQSRAQVGSRLQAVNMTQDSLQKAVIDNKMAASLAEDADLFQLASDISKADATLKATLETSGKVIQPSLLDFLR